MTAADRAARALLAGLLLAAVAGCYRPAIDDCQISCRPGAACPDDMMCMGGFCSRGRSCGTPPPDGGAPDGAPDDARDALEISTPADGATPDAPLSDGAGAADGPRDAGDGRAPDSAADGATTDTTTDTAAWTPPATIDVVLWLDATQGIAAGDQPVSVWLDRSGKANHARQAAPMSMPVRTMNRIHGLPAVTFDGRLTSLVVADDASLQWGTGDYALFLIGRSSNVSPTSQPFFFSKQAPPYPFNGPALYVSDWLSDVPGEITAQDDVNHTAMSSRPYHDGAFHMFVSHRAGTKMRLRIDGEELGWISEVPTLNVDAVGGPVVIGHGGDPPANGSQALKGDIAEVLAVRGPIADADLSAIEAHLMSKYGLAPATQPPARLPADVDDLVLWLDAATGVTSDRAFLWRDQSPAGNDARAPAGAGAPRVARPWAGVPAAIQFSGDNQFLSLPPGMRDFTLGLTAFIVVEVQAPLVVGDLGAIDGTRFLDFAPAFGDAAGGILLQREGLQGNELRYIVCGLTDCPAGAFAGDVVRENTRQLLEVQVPGGREGDGKSFLYFENGLTVGWGYAVVPQVVNRQSVLIGRSNVARDGRPDHADLRGYVGEIIVYDRFLEDGERRGVERYLLDRWKLR